MLYSYNKAFSNTRHYWWTYGELYFESGWDHRRLNIMGSLNIPEAHIKLKRSGREKRFRWGYKHLHDNNIVQFHLFTWSLSDLFRQPFFLCHGYSCHEGCYSFQARRYSCRQ